MCIRDRATAGYPIILTDPTERTRENRYGTRLLRNLNYFLLLNFRSWNRIFRLRNKEAAMILAFTVFLVNKVTLELLNNTQNQGVIRFIQLHSKIHNQTAAFRVKLEAGSSCQLTRQLSKNLIRQTLLLNHLRFPLSRFISISTIWRLKRQLKKHKSSG